MQNLTSPSIVAQIKKLVDLTSEEKIARRLDFIYRRVPMNNCRRCADCCFNGPQVYDVEFLNIYDFLRSLSQLEQRRLGRKLVEYEMLNLTTLKNKCPFLQENECLIFERRPLQCRFFGLYPREEYSAIVEDCGRQNEALANHYAVAKKLKLPSDVMTYDIDQCANNIDPAGNVVVVSAEERSRLSAQVSDLGRQALHVQSDSSGLISFSNQYVLMYLSDELLEDKKARAIREFQKTGRSHTLDSLLTEHAWQF